MIVLVFAILLLHLLFQNLYLYLYLILSVYLMSSTWENG